MKFNRRLAAILALVVSLLYFLVKGVVYYTLGSPIPLIFIMLVLVLLIVSAKRTELAFRRALTFWVVLLIIWSGLRLLLLAADEFIKPVPEAHVYYALKDGLIWSVLFLVSGILLLFNKRVVTETVMKKLKH